ncbi:hypothetical protein EX30DRAFT_161987 [Ascodesmis nigricans]|uniref:Uncharacterized protein n=1 Tax=Ascodesmis nigricans TaxID=341454 RepID=A0A4V3SI10_9PEZI|nr:hypothetical protein EX30DRAFT_161987 [Ascodesmis nigricans]
MGSSKSTLSIFLPVFFACLVLCFAILCACYSCRNTRRFRYLPIFHILGVGSRGDDSDYDSDVEKVPRRKKKKKRRRQRPQIVVEEPYSAPTVCDVSVFWILGSVGETVRRRVMGRNAWSHAMSRLHPASRLITPGSPCHDAPSPSFAEGL